MMREWTFKLSPSGGLLTLDDGNLSTAAGRNSRVMDYVVTCQAIEAAAYEVMGPAGKFAPLPGDDGSPKAPLEIFVVNGAFTRVQVTTAGLVHFTVTPKALGLAN